MRWADLDSLNHVNNVVYLDYAAESRAMLVDDGIISADRDVSRMVVDFVKPLLLSRRPVQVASTPDGDDVTQEIRSGGSETVFARVVTTYGRRDPLRPVTHVAAQPARIRRSDLDVTGAVSTTKVFELFQEARVLQLSTALTDMAPGRFVVARVDVLLAQPIGWRPEPYDARSWVSRVGTSSVTIESQLSDGDVVLAQCSSVLVGFDLETQQSRPLSDGERDDLAALTPRR